MGSSYCWCGKAGSIAGTQELQYGIRKGPVLSTDCSNCKQLSEESNFSGTAATNTCCR
jgi:hypothetical protein